VKVVVAPNAFKGSLTAREAASAMAAGVRRALPDAPVVEVPVADGGDGLVDVALKALNGETRSLAVTGPHDRPITASFCHVPSERLAVIEMALASGLVLVAESERDLLTATSRGVGELIRAAVALGCARIIVGIGGSATNDGGIGMAAALAGRFSDTVLMWITDLAYAFPDLLAIILLRQVLLGRNWPIIGEGNPQIPGFNGVLLVTVIAISFVSWTTVARLVRGQMLSIKEQDYVTAARAMGASPWRVVRVHMLPNTLSAVIVSATFGIPLAIFAEATLGFIGLGVPPPNASLGSLIGAGLDSIQVHPVQLIWPTLMVATLMLCFTFLGDGLRDALDPRTRR